MANKVCTFCLVRFFSQHSNFFKYDFVSHISLHICFWSDFLPYGYSFFQIIKNPHKCRGPITNYLYTYIGSLNWPYRWGWASPAMKCGLNMHKPVDRPMHEVIDELALDNELFAEKFLEGWQIMTNNGYFKVSFNT